MLFLFDLGRVLRGAPQRDLAADQLDEVRGRVAQWIARMILAW